MSSHPYDPPQLPGTVLPNVFVLYQFGDGNGRLAHVVVTGATNEVTYEFPAGNLVKYIPQREHWFLRSGAAGALLSADKLPFIVQARGTPEELEQIVRDYQADSALHFRAQGHLEKAHWTHGKPSNPPANSITLQGIEPRAKRDLTLRLELDQDGAKLARAVWHSDTDAPVPFFEGDPKVGDRVELHRITHDPWASGSHYYFDKVETA